MNFNTLRILKLKCQNQNATLTIINNDLITKINISINNKNYICVIIKNIFFELI